ncbi:MAG: MFS transporter [Corynebacterium sp.]|nr:MFS transporter [Corynebacterium sp.]
MGLNGFDSTAINPALPSIAIEFGINSGDLGAIEWGFLAASAVILPLAPYLGNKYGVARVFSICLLNFSIGLALAAFSPHYLVLVLGRIMQGLASGALIPLGLALLYGGVTGQQRLRISQILLIPLTLAPMAGPIVGGVIAEAWGWRTIFWIMLPFGIITAIVSYFVMPNGMESRENDHQEPQVIAPKCLALASFACLGLSISGPIITTGLSGEFRLYLVFLAIGSAAGGLLAIRGIQKVGKSDLLVNNFGTWCIRSYRINSYMNSGFTGIVAAFLFVVPITLADAGYNAKHIGIIMFPETLGLLLGGQLVTLLTKKISARTLILGTAMLGICSTYSIIVAPVRTNILISAVAMAFFGILMSQAVLITQAAAFGEISEQAMAGSTAGQIMLRNITSAWMVAIFALLLQLLEPYWVWFALGSIWAGFAAMAWCLTKQQWAELLA